MECVLNITFLLGNGFDLNLGLETGYTSFLKDYRNVRNEESEYIKWFKDEVLKDEKLWSSAEVAFGIRTKIFSEKKYGADMFCDCHEDFCMNLAQYLEKQEARINYAQLDAYISSSFAK